MRLRALVDCGECEGTGCIDVEYHIMCAACCGSGSVERAIELAELCVVMKHLMRDHETELAPLGHAGLELLAELREKLHCKGKKNGKGSQLAAKEYLTGEQR